MIIYSQGATGDIEVEWDPQTGAVRVHPDGDWIEPSNINASPIEDPFIVEC